MSIANIFEQNEIPTNWSFVIAKLKHQEGIMFFKTVVNEVDGEQTTDLDPQCFIIDGAKFVYTDDLKSDVIMHSVDDIIVFNWADGTKLNVNTRIVEEFPFKHETFGIPSEQNPAPDHVKIE